MRVAKFALPALALLGLIALAIFSNVLPANAQTGLGPQQVWDLVRQKASKASCSFVGGRCTCKAVFPYGFDLFRTINMAQEEVEAILGHFNYVNAWDGSLFIFNVPPELEGEFCKQTQQPETHPVPVPVFDGAPAFQPDSDRQTDFSFPHIDPAPAQVQTIQSWEIIGIVLLLILLTVGAMALAH